MGIGIIKADRISLNEITYPIHGPIRVHYLDNFADKMTIGDDSYDNRRFLSSWTMNDQRKGIGVENFRDINDLLRCWFSQGNLDNANQVTLPHLATALTLTTLPTITYAGTEPFTKAVAATNTDATGWNNQFRAKPITVTVTFTSSGCDANNNIIITLSDGIGTLDTETVTTNAFQTLKLSGTLNTAATRIRITIDQVNDGGSPTATGIVYSIATVATYSSVKFCNFNSDLYFAVNAVLYRVNHYTGTVTLEGIFPNTITALTASIDNYLYIYLGDSDNYWYMDSGTYADVLVDTDEALDSTETGVDLDADATTLILVGSIIRVESEYMYVSATGASLTVTRGFLGTTATSHVTNTDVYILRTVFADAGTGTAANCQNATLGGHWGGYLWKQNAAGQIYYTDDPNRDDPTWTVSASLAALGLPSGTCQELRVENNEDGVSTIAACTNDGVFLLDPTLANARFLATSIAFPSHSTAGKGVARSPFDRSTYVSAGLSVKRFYGGSLEGDAGLDKDDGLPAEYDGEIVAMCASNRDIFALVDASLVTGPAYSSVQKFNGLGWQVLWDASQINAWVYDFTGASGTGWTNLANAYDNNTATYASSPSVTAGAWSAYATYTIGATYTNLLKFYATSDGNGTVNEIDIDVSADSGSTWVDVFSGTFTADTWTSYYVALAAYDRVRVRFKNNHATTAGIGYLKEIQVSEAVIDKTMHACIVTSAYTYGLVFDHNNAIYRIPLQKSLFNPKKVSGYTFAAGPILHFMPWFAAGAPAFEKLEAALSAFCRDTTSTELIRVMYRIDKTYTNLFSGWTVLGTVAAAGAGTATEYLFASGAGLAYKHIQFAFELVRGSTTTLAPVLESFTSSFLKKAKVKAWTFTLDMTEKSGGLTPRSMKENLATAMATKTLKKFTYRDESFTDEVYYVSILPFSGQEETGHGHEGTWEITVVDPVTLY